MATKRDPMDNNPHMRDCSVWKGLACDCEASRKPGEKPRTKPEDTPDTKLEEVTLPTTELRPHTPQCSYWTKAADGHPNDCNCVEGRAVHTDNGVVTEEPLDPGPPMRAESVDAVKHAAKCAIWTVVGEVPGSCDCGADDGKKPERDFSIPHVVIINATIPALMTGDPDDCNTYFKAIGRNRHERRQHARRLMDAITKPNVRSNRPWREPKIEYADELSPMETAKYFGGTPVEAWK